MKPSGSNVFKIISEGSKNNASMVAWKGNLSSTDIQSVASYILTLKGTKPAGAKAAEGEVWKETAAVAPTAPTVVDSTKIIADPVK